MFVSFRTGRARVDKGQDHKETGSNIDSNGVKTMIKPHYHHTTVALRRGMVTIGTLGLAEDMAELPPPGSGADIHLDGVGADGVSE